MILGLDPILARAAWEHVHKQQTPVFLADLLARRAFSATGELNEEKRQQAEKLLTIDVSGDAAKLTVKEAQFKLGGVFPFLDALEGLKWVICWLGFVTTDEDVEPYVAFMSRRVRRDPSRLPMLVKCDLAARWKIAVAQRRGQTYKAAQAEVLRDTEWWAEKLGLFDYRIHPAFDGASAYNDTEATGTSSEQVPAEPATKKRREKSPDKKIMNQAKHIQQLEATIAALKAGRANGAQGFLRPAPKATLLTPRPPVTPRPTGRTGFPAGWDPAWRDEPQACRRWQVGLCQAAQCPNGRTHGKCAKCGKDGHRAVDCH